MGVQHRMVVPFKFIVTPINPSKKVVDDILPDTCNLVINLSAYFELNITERNTLG